MPWFHRYDRLSGEHGMKRVQSECWHARDYYEFMANFVIGITWGSGSRCRGDLGWFWE